MMHVTSGQDTPPDRSEPLYGIGTVARMTGVSPPALRMWEERYGVVEPARDDSGRRLFSQEQLDDLIWVSESISKGLTAAEAHRMLEYRRSRIHHRHGLKPSFRQWVLVDHAWINRLCEEMVERVAGALLVYVGIHEFERPESGSWLLISVLKKDRPTHFVGSAHRAARIHGDRLKHGESVVSTSGEGSEEVTESAVPLMREGEWVGTVAVVSLSGPTESHVLDMRDRIYARWESTEAYARFEEVTQ